MLVDSSDQSINVETTSCEDIDGIGAFEPFLIPIVPELDCLSLIHISGRPEYQNRIRSLCKEFEVLFSRKSRKRTQSL